MCFLFSNKKGPPNNQPGAADRKAAPENFPWEEFQKLPGLYLTSPAVLAVILRQTEATATRLARTPAILPIHEGLDLGRISRTVYRVELQDGESIGTLQGKPQRPRVPREQLAPQARVYVHPPSSARPGPFPPTPPTPATPSPPTPPPCAEATPTPAQSPPRRLTRPPAHVHLPPGPASPRHPQGRASSLPPHAVRTHTLSEAHTTCRKPP